MPTRELTEGRNVTLYPSHWDTVQQFTDEMGYYGISAAIRRIIDEWQELKKANSPEEVRA